MKASSIKFHLTPNQSSFPAWIFLFSLLTACGGGGGGSNPSAPAIGTIEVSPSTVTIAKNGSRQFSATARDAAGTTISGVTFTWSSDHPDIVSIDSNGLSSGMAEGTATITASAGGVSGAATVQVIFRLFSSTNNYPVGATPLAITTGDFNHDGIVDLAVANSDGNTISLLKGAGSGLFSAAQDFPVGVFPQSLIAGRFNNDLFDDLAVANFGDPLHPASISIFLGIDAGIGSGTEIPLSGSGPIAMATADFNGGGNQDLATANLSTSNLSLILGNGDGTFQSALPFATNGSGPPIALLSADLDNDGRPDLVAVLGSASDNKIAILFNDGAGGFFDPQLLPVGTGPNSVISGDWNGDGKVDLAVVNSGSADLTVLIGDGIGGFSVQTLPLAGAGRLEFAATGDFNHDTKPDIAVSDSTNKVIFILLNIGGGLFSDPIQQSTGNRPLAIAAKDLNGDGKDDLVVTNAGDNTISVFLQ